jgi:hypothetical protein
MSAAILFVIPVVIAMACLVNVAEAADSTVVYAYPSGDTSGMSAQLAPGIGGCTFGCATLYVAAKTSLPARRQGLVAFAAPAGTTIVSAAISLRYRTLNQGLSVHLQTRIAGRWLDSRRLRSAASKSGTYRVGGGGTAVAVTLTSDVAVAGKAVKKATDNSATITGVSLVVRDVIAPTVAWTGGDPSTGFWQRGPLCGWFSAQDVGLGVDRVDYAVGGIVASSVAPAGPRLQPRPSTYAGTICLDSTLLEDGVYGSALGAIDTSPEGNHSRLVGGVVRVDNTAPIVAFVPPTDGEARMPPLLLQVEDRASGVATTALSIDGVPLIAKVTGGSIVATPNQPLTDGLHRVAWTVVDNAGNSTSDGATIGVADVTPPLIDTIAPLGIATNLATISARITDSGSGVTVDAIRLAVDGVEVSALSDIFDGQVRYEPGRPWTEGEHVVRLTASDRSGNRSVRTWTFQLPVTPAPVAPVAPPADAAVSMPSIADAQEITAGESDAALDVRLPTMITTHGRRTTLTVAVSRGASLAAGQRVRLRWGSGVALPDVVTDESGTAVVALAANARGTLRVTVGTISRSVRVLVGSALTLTATLRTVRSGGQVQLEGGIFGSTAARVRIEARVGRVWQLVTSVTCRGKRFATPVRLPSNGRYLVRARAGRLVSQPLSLTAR